MKRILVAALALALCVALVLSGCQRETAARESFEQNPAQQPAKENAPGPEPSEEEPEEIPGLEEPQRDADWYADRYIRGGYYEPGDFTRGLYYRDIK